MGNFYQIDINGNASFTNPVTVGLPTLPGHAATKSYADSGFQQIFSTSSFSPVPPFISGKVYIVDPALNASVTFGLPAAASVGAGFIMTVKSNSLGITTLVPTGGDTLEYNINNLGNSNSVSVISNGTNSWKVLWNDNITGVLSVINGISSLNSGVVSNVNLANMPPNTVKANTTAISSTPSDVPLASFKAWLGLMLNPNRMVLTDGAGSIITNSSYVVDGAGALTLAGKLTASGGSGVTITGAAPSLHVGSNTDVGEATGAGQFSTSAITGDSVIRAGSGNTLRLLAGNGASVLDITSSLANLNFPITFPQTQGGSTVASAVKTQFEYDELYIHATPLSGALAVSSFNAAYVFRKNNIVTLILNPWGGANATASATETFTNVLPARFRPALAQIQDICSVTRNNIRAGLVRVTNTGAVTFFGDETGGSFNNNQIAAFSGGKVISYSVT